jgi:predicted enzyme related to lactoylglutathione lyase
MTPTLANGKICYVELPALDIHRSAEFYEKVFGWGLRQRGDGSITFDDATGEVRIRQSESPVYYLYAQRLSPINEDRRETQLEA